MVIGQSLLVKDQVGQPIPINNYYVQLTINDYFDFINLPGDLPHGATNRTYSR